MIEAKSSGKGKPEEPDLSNSAATGKPTKSTNGCSARTASPERPAQLRPLPNQGAARARTSPAPWLRLPLYLCLSPSHLPANHLSLRPSRRKEPACVSRSSLRKPADSGVRTRTSAALKRGGRPPRADVLAGSRLPALRRRSMRKVGPL